MREKVQETEDKNRDDRPQSSEQKSTGNEKSLRKKRKQFGLFWKNDCAASSVEP